MGVYSSIVWCLVERWVCTRLLFGVSLKDGCVLVYCLDSLSKMGVYSSIVWCLVERWVCTGLLFGVSLKDGCVLVYCLVSR